MRFRRGTKVRIKYIDSRGRPAFAIRWWSQVDAFCARAAAAGATEMFVRGRGWKSWRRWRPATAPRR